MINHNNLEGHRERYEVLLARKPAEDVARLYVGGGDEYLTGFFELDIISRYRPLKGADVIDIGCGIGRLVRYLVKEPVNSYLGTDILPEIIQHARDKAASAGRKDFRFEIVSDCLIPAEDSGADLICAFSVITHLLDNEMFGYFREIGRVLRPGGVATLSFLDFGLPHIKDWFVDHFENRHKWQDVLKFFEKDTLTFFCRAFRAESRICR
jgi:SAM-dependent methyltransferase